MAKTKIEWCDAVWNPVTGCTPTSEGCQNCYARRMAKRLAGRCGYPKDDPFRVTLHPDRFDEPLRWRKPRRVFVCSMGDLFHEDVPFEYINKTFRSIALADRRHTFMLLTKRPERMKYWFDKHPKGPCIGGDITFNPLYPSWPLPNLWLGVTAENQQRADERIPILLQIPAAVRFVSVEPMLGPMEIWRYLPQVESERVSFATRQTMLCPPRKLDWVICGSESGPNRRPANIEWIRKLKDQCVAAGIPFFLKQLEINSKLVKMPELDGQIWDEMPEVTL